MKFQIQHETAGRLRVRCLAQEGRNVRSFSLEQGAAILGGLERVPGIRKVKLYSGAAGIAVLYRPDDLGKIREISSDLGFPYTTEGRLMGHISIGAMAVDRAARKIPELSPDKRERLLHIILSHHGDQDKGSPVVCVTKEAFIVHYADEVDSIMNQFHEKERSETWEYDKMLQLYLWKV